MHTVKVWRNGAYSIQYYETNRIHWDSKIRKYKTSTFNRPIPAGGRRELKFPITKKSKLTFLSRSVRLFEEAEHNVSSQILTFPMYLDFYHEKRIIANPYHYLNRYLTNMRKTYGLKRYVSALEETKEEVYHFHLLVDLPFVKASKINDAWCAARDSYSPNAVRDIRKVKNPVSAMHYAAKYFSKSDSKEHDLKKFTYSKNLMDCDYTYIDRKTFFEQFESVYRREWDWCITGNVSYSSRLRMLFDEEMNEKECMEDAKKTQILR